MKYLPKSLAWAISVLLVSSLVLSSSVTQINLATQVKGQLPVANLATGVITRSITYIAGCDNCVALVAADDQLTFFRNNIAPMTITEGWCESDTGSPVINLQRDDGTPANVFSSDCTCTTGGTICTIDTAEDNLAVGDKLDFVLVTAAGNRVTVNLKVPLD